MVKERDGNKWSRNETARARHVRVQEGGGEETSRDSGPPRGTSKVARVLGVRYKSRFKNGLAFPAKSGTRSSVQIAFAAGSTSPVGAGVRSFAYVTFSSGPIKPASMVIGSSEHEALRDNQKSRAVDRLARGTSFSDNMSLR